MAWLDNRWIGRSERAELIDIYSEYLRIVDAAYPSMDDIEGAGLLTEYFDRLSLLNRLERIHRCEGNLEEFAIEYFSEHGNPDNSGNWADFAAKSPADIANFHHKLTAMMDDVAMNDRSGKVSAAIARSHGKSTWLSKGFPVSEIVYRRRKYVIIISETPSVAKANMEWIRNQLKYNDKLREDFGPLLSPKDQSNVLDNSEEFIAWHPDGDSKNQIAIVQAASTGQALRGRNWNSNRPDLIICDDLEDARPGGNASTPEQRQKMRSWFTQTVMPLGDPKGKRTAIVVMGTTVHRESLLMHILYERSDFKAQVYRAIISEPIRMDLWEQCRLIYAAKENPNHAEEAIAFYEENRAIMDEGAEVLWEEAQPIWRLMRWKWDNGSLAFNTEYMNNPIDEESMVFNPETFTYHTGDIDYLSDRFEVSMGIDFAMGKQRGDYSAIVTTARDKTNGLIYIIDAYGDRVKPDVFMRQIVERVMKYQPTVIGAEAQMAQEFFVDELKKALTKVGYPAASRVKKIHQRNRKELRIEAMLPSIENGTIRFDRRHALLLEQFEMYGTGAHEDVVDSLEISISCTNTGTATIRTVRPMRRW